MEPNNNNVKSNHESAKPPPVQDNPKPAASGNHSRGSGRKPAYNSDRNKGSNQSNWRSNSPNFPEEETERKPRSANQADTNNHKSTGNQRRPQSHSKYTSHNSQSGYNKSSSSSSRDQGKTNQRAIAKSFNPSPTHSTNSSEEEDACVVCYRKISAYSIGACEHPVCFECSARMRVLMEQNECPICRTALDHVIFTSTPISFSAAQQISSLILIQQFGIFCEDAEMKGRFYELLEFSCTECTDGPRKTFEDFEGFRMHMQRAHALFSCGLCTEFIKHFPRERKFYTRAQLATHNRIGDPSDTSHRGHPLCEFCDVRHFDSDELFRHLRKDHYFCHFCDADGFNFYYSGYEELRLHFRREHFLCEEEGCKDEKFTSVFRSEIDWKAHLTSVHSRLLGKHGTKAARSLDVAFSLPVRQRRGLTGTTLPSPQTEQQPVFASIDVESVNEFPQLAGMTAPVTPMVAPVQRSAKWSMTRMEEDFPALQVTTSEGNPTVPQPSFSHRAAMNGPNRSYRAPPPASSGLPTASDFPSLPTRTASSAGAWRPPAPKPSARSSSSSKKPAPAPQLDFVPLPLPKPKKVYQPKKPPPPLPTSEELRAQLLADGAVLLKRDEAEEVPTRVKKKGG